MVLDGGTYAGRRVVSAAWIAASLAPHVAIDMVDPYAAAATGHGARRRSFYRS